MTYQEPVMMHTTGHRFPAPSLAEALDRGLLPDYETSIALEATL